ncbi:butyrophilin-like protein 8 [Austrofundulus limnaeus]|uniref:Butyrophilin-like protein 8 n=1 Tax=Austrofundulus limnaeus TaxID=52670 RepID=A0A2I4AVN7_AUSLI|nr:PREDICTED: butyrophilin-like protein 8 [Austrofundulus limnaeus]
MKCKPVYELQLASAGEGEPSVLLPCKTRRFLPADATVEWRHINKDVVVHMYSNDTRQPIIQIENYQNRTKMMENPLRTGDLSLTLHSPCPADSGLYVCTVQKRGHKVKQKVVSLHVKENGAFLVADLVFGDVVPDGQLCPPENRTGSIGDDESLRGGLKDSLRGSLKGSTDQRSSASSLWSSNREVHLSHQSIYEND